MKQTELDIIRKFSELIFENGGDVVFHHHDGCWSVSNFDDLVAFIVDPFSLVAKMRNISKERAIELDPTAFGERHDLS